MESRRRLTRENGVVAAPSEEDFSDEGLLDGLEGEHRDARLALLRDLADDGVSLSELSDAVAAGRLALLPVERALIGDGPRYTAEEVAEKSGVPIERLMRNTAALGLPTPDPGDRVLTEADVDAAERLKALSDAGLPEDGMLQVARTLGMATSRIAEANRELILRTVVHEGDSEHDLALRLATAARSMIPLVGPTLTYAMQMHLLEQVRRDVIGDELDTSGLGAATEMTVCFADMVGFTKLGEQIAMDELGRVAGRLEELALEVVESPVRLVKLIGDAVMLVSPEPTPLVDAALALVQAADEEGEEFPQLRAGLARGAALAQGGDIYGRPVNLASRITDVARPGSVLVAGELGDAVKDSYRSSFAGERRLKGIDGQVKLYRLRTLDSGDD